MLISKRDAVRRTSDVALATRVLNGGSNARLLRRPKPAAGHAHDPHWRPSDEDLDDDLDDDADDAPTDRTPAVAQAVIEDVGPEYLDVDVIEEDAEALPAGRSAAEAVESEELQLEFDDEPAEVAEEAPVLEIAEEADEPEAEDVAEVGEREVESDDEPDGTEDEYEYVADSSGLEAPSESELQLADSLTAARRRRYDSATANAVSVRKYKFRKRMLTAMIVMVAASAIAAALLGPTLWYVCGGIAAVTVLYLGYLRRQTRIEERLRRRRAQRIARSRLGVENTDDREFDVVPARLRRPGSVVLEIDDEDPIFEHLDYTPFARHFDLPHAAGQ
jgi:hypothetical protein